MTDPGVIDPVYPPYSVGDLEARFAFAARGRREQHVRRFTASAERYAAHRAAQRGPATMPSNLRRARQLETDEMFWPAARLMGFYRAGNPGGRFAALLEPAFGPRPPIAGPEWKERPSALGGSLGRTARRSSPDPVASLTGRPGIEPRARRGNRARSMVLPMPRPGGLCRSH